MSLSAGRRIARDDCPGVLRLTALQLAGRGIVTGGEFVRAEARRAPLIGQRLGVAA
jgi:hypothetical protein